MQLLEIDSSDVVFPAIMGLLIWSIILFVLIKAGVRAGNKDLVDQQIKTNRLLKAKMQREGFSPTELEDVTTL
jgi:hypothetical protein